MPRQPKSVEDLAGCFALAIRQLQGKCEVCKYSGFDNLVYCQDCEKGSKWKWNGFEEEAIYNDDDMSLGAGLLVED